MPLWSKGFETDSNSSLFSHRWSVLSYCEIYACMRANGVEKDLKHWLLPNYRKAFRMIVLQQRFLKAAGSLSSKVSHWIYYSVHLVIAEEQDQLSQDVWVYPRLNTSWVHLSSHECRKWNIVQYLMPPWNIFSHLCLFSKYAANKCLYVLFCINRIVSRDKESWGLALGLCPKSRWAR